MYIAKSLNKTEKEFTYITIFLCSINFKKNFNLASNVTFII